MLPPAAGLDGYETQGLIDFHWEEAAEGIYGPYIYTYQWISVIIQSLLLRRPGYFY